MATFDELIRLVHETTPDVIVTDIRMPPSGSVVARKQLAPDLLEAIDRRGFRQVLPFGWVGLSDRHAAGRERSGEHGDGDREALQVRVMDGCQRAVPRHL